MSVCACVFKPWLQTRLGALFRNTISCGENTVPLCQRSFLGEIAVSSWHNHSDKLCNHIIIQWSHNKTFHCYYSKKYHQNISVLSSDHSLALSPDSFVFNLFSPQRKYTKVLSLAIISSNSPPSDLLTSCPARQSLLPPDASPRDLSA